MPQLEVSSHLQIAVLLEFVGVDNYGTPTVDPPIELNPNNRPPDGVRWEDTRKSTFGAQTDAHAYDADVFTNRHIRIGSILRLGTLASYNAALATAGTTSTQMFLHQVQDVEVIPDIKGRNISYILHCVKYNELLPVVIGTGSPGYVPPAKP